MIAVIGTGVVGACVGYYLARDGAEVKLVDAAQPGALTTSASFAWVNASSKADHGAYFELNAAGLSEYQRLLGDSLDGTWWNPTGHVRWDYRDEGELEHRVQQLRERGYPAEIWTAARVRRELEPNLGSVARHKLMAVFPSEAWVDGPMMVKELVAAAVRKGASTAFGSPVHRVTVEAGAVTSIELASGLRYPVDAVVNAAGPAASAVAALVGRALPMQEQPGLAVRVRTKTDSVRRVMHSPGIAMRPDGPGRAFLLLRALEPSLRAGQQSLTELADQARRVAGGVVPRLADATVLDARVGHRPIVGDGLPAIGKAAGIAGYYEAVTHSGITLGPILARALTAEILHGRIDPLVAAFRASRMGVT